MRLAKALLAHKQTRTSVMSVQRNEVAGAERRGHVANLNRAKSFNISCPLCHNAAPAQQEALDD